MKTADARIFPVVADTPDEALAWFALIAPHAQLLRDGKPMPIVSVDMDREARLLVEVEDWWGNYCDYAQDNENVDDIEYDDVLGLFFRTRDEVYRLCGE